MFRRMGRREQRQVELALAVLIGPDKVGKDDAQELAKFVCSI